MNLLLLDSYNLLYRAFVTLPASITAGDGKPINALYGMLASLLRYARDLDSSYIIAAFDEPETPTFRHSLYPAYQGHRGPMGGDNAAEFLRQVRLAMGALPRLEIPAISSPGFEADDVMGTLAYRCIERGGHATLVSTDRDLLQLVQPGISVLVPGKVSVRLSDASDVRARMGVNPVSIPTLKSLAGDASDNIPGVQGIGSKTAISLVDRYTDLETIYEHLVDLPTRTAQALQAGRDDAFLFRQVASIITNLEIPLDISALINAVFGPDVRARALLQRAGLDEA